MYLLYHAERSFVSTEVNLLTPHLTSPFRLKPLDIETMKRLGSRVNLIPVIAKADTMTPQDILAFKENVRRRALYEPAKRSQAMSTGPQGHCCAGDQGVRSASGRRR